MSSEKIIFDYSTPKTLHLKLQGDWRITSGLPAVTRITSELKVRKDISQITFDMLQMQEWDSGFVSFLLQLFRECEHKNIHIAREGLSQGAQKLLTLALVVHEKNLSRQKTREPFFGRVTDRVTKTEENIRFLLHFLGEIAVSFGRLLVGKAYFRWDEFVYIVQRCGIDALPLVSLISMLVGMILAFIGAIQLKLFGVQIFIADIVGIAAVRVMGAVMTGILMSGRTGASFAAELGIMQVNEEIDALKTLGVSPIDFLVLPRILALVVMMPLLTLYADLMGIVGGFVVSTGMLGLNPVEYLTHTHDAIKISYLWVGLVHSFVFGIIIAITGCLRGIKCERNAAAVGEATTSAVVSGITAIVIATAIITFVCQVLGV
ncbi:MAG: ABC transporter permease [Candidatus Omnitrophota bacterium]